MSKILSINEDKKWVLGTYPSKMAGIEVVTETATWFARIDDESSCCEDWGYFVLNDENAEYFVGAELFDVEVVDTALNVKKIEEADLYLDDGGIMFVNFITSMGVMQFALYNEQNGYHGHDAQVGRTTTEDTTILHEDTL